MKKNAKKEDYGNVQKASVNTTRALTKIRIEYLNTVPTAQFHI